jgi:hypothetical protein
MDVVEKNFAVFELGVAVAEIGFAGPQRFDLRAAEHHADLEDLIDVVIVKRLFVFTDDFLSHGALCS